MGKTQVTAELAEFIERTQISQIPDPVVQTAKLLIMDLLGVATAGSIEKPAIIIHELIEEQGGSGNATLIGTAYKSSPAWSALANGISGHVLDFDTVGKVESELGPISQNQAGLGQFSGEKSAQRF